MVIYITCDASMGNPLATLGATLNTPPLRELAYKPPTLRILWDKTIVIHSHDGMIGYIPGVKYIHKKIVFRKPIKVSKNPGTTYVNKDIRFACLSDSTAVPNPGFTSGFIRARWIDV